MCVDCLFFKVTEPSPLQQRLLRLQQNRIFVTILSSLAGLNFDDDFSSVCCSIPFRFCFDWGYKKSERVTCGNVYCPSNQPSLSPPAHSTRTLFSLSLSLSHTHSLSFSDSKRLAAGTGKDSQPNTPVKNKNPRQCWREATRARPRPCLQRPCATAAQS